jgi:hypothetical protein
MRLITLSDIKLSLDKDERELFRIATKKLGKPPRYFRIRKKSLDARNKSDVRFVYTIDFSDEEERQTPQPLERLH